MELVNLLLTCEFTINLNFNMKEELIKIVADNIGSIVSTFTTLLLAYIKKKIEVRKWKKQGRLIDLDKVIMNGKQK